MFSKGFSGMGKSIPGSSPLSDSESVGVSGPATRLRNIEQIGHLNIF
jgi:hypothetical protein